MIVNLSTAPSTRDGLRYLAATIEAHPTTANCRRLLDLGEHVLLGVSPFNTQFDESYLIRLFSWAGSNFDSFTVALPGEREAALMLEATGRRRARPPVRPGRNSTATRV